MVFKNILLVTAFVFGFTATNLLAQSYEEYMEKYEYGAREIPAQQPVQQTQPQYQQQALQQQVARTFRETYPANFNNDYIYGCVQQQIKTPIPISKQLKTEYCACMAEQMKDRMSFADFRLMDTVTDMRDMKRMPQNVLDGVQAGANACFIQSGAKMFFGK